ncbi:MAG: hypothetical protein ACM3ZC_12245 [Bacteroidota bacterium]
MLEVCNHEHRNWPFFESLPYDQGGHGRHKCAGCAYERGYQAGLARQEVIQLDLDSLPESQAGVVRHKSPHAAFAMGYMDGVHASYRN